MSGDSSIGRRRLPHEGSTGHERECARHGVTVFHRYASGQVRCKRCVGEAVTRRHRKLKALLVAEAGGCCAICGYDRTPRNLVFHHVDPATKSFPMTMARGKSEAAYRAELAKCVLLCANCHGEVEAGLVVSPPAGARYPHGDSNSDYGRERPAC